MDGGPAIGVDLGGTKIEVVALDRDGRELRRRRVPTPRGDYEGTLRTVRDMVFGIEAELGGGRGTVGVGHPGTISPATGLIKNANSTWLIGRPFDRDMRAALERPVALANDANCLALSEATDGAGAGAPVVFAVIIGTGVGGGVCVHGRVLHGPNGIAGEWGHNALPWPRPEELPGPPCYCGLHGCTETFLSGPGLALDHATATGGDGNGVRQDPPAILASAAAGDGAAEATLRRYEDRLARALAAVINVLDPDVVVLGGGLSRVERLYTAVPRLWGRHVFSDTVRTALRQAVHGDSSGVRGAAWLGRDLAAAGAAAVSGNPPAAGVPPAAPAPR